MTTIRHPAHETGHDGAGLQIRLDETGSGADGSIAGELDVSTADVLRDAAEELKALHVQGHVVLDASGLNFVDVVGMTTLEHTADLVAACGGRLELVRCQHSVRTLARLLRSDAPLYHGDSAPAEHRGHR
jgi:anti-anti-sigma factor